MSIDPGDFGTVGLLDISQQNRWIKVIKLGFDFEYNPVCFLSSADGLIQPVHAFESDYMFPVGLKSPKSGWGKGELQESLDICRLNPLSTKEWSNLYDGTAWPVPGELNSLWALKGDRLDGLDVEIRNKRFTFATLRIVRGEFQDKVVWDVYLDEEFNERIPLSAVCSGGYNSI
jgi:hypothetical protein